MMYWGWWSNFSEIKFIADINTIINTALKYQKQNNVIKRCWCSIQEWIGKKLLKPIW